MAGGMVEGRVALVTGASTGFGAHFARLLHREGADVILAARSQPAIEQLAGELGPRARAIALDVTDGKSVAKLTSLERVDILINNAGIARAKPALDHDEEDWDAVVDTNLKGAWLVAQTVAPIMRGHGGGSIVNIASVLGLRLAKGVLPYAISKAGVIQMTKGLALELAPDQIRVNAIAPGYFHTAINDGFWDTDRGKAMIGRIPQRRLGQVEDLDGPLLLLASDASRYMTGAVIAVDGGHLVSSL